MLLSNRKRTITVGAKYRPLNHDFCISYRIRWASGPWRVRSCTNCSSVVFFFTSPRARGCPWDLLASNAPFAVAPERINRSSGVPGPISKKEEVFLQIDKTCFGGIAPKQSTNQTQSTHVRPMPEKGSNKFICGTPFYWFSTFSQTCENIIFLFKEKTGFGMFFASEIFHLLINFLIDFSWFFKTIPGERF